MTLSVKDKGIYLLLVAALVLRFWGAMDVREMVGDEYNVVTATRNYIGSGHFAPLQWVHPPFPYLLTYASMGILGDNAYGWRLRSVLIGAMTVLALFLLAKELFSNPRVAYLASLLVAIDPLHVLLSRTMSSEITSMFCFVLAVYITVRYLKGGRGSPWPAGLLFGMALADRWYYLPSLLALVLFLSAMRIRAEGFRWTDVAHLFSIYILLPLGVYLLTFVPWFQRGYTLGEFVHMQLDAYWELQFTTVDSFKDPFMRMLPASPWTWFVEPLVAGMQVEKAGAWGRYFVIMNNPPVWLATVPAFLYTGYRAWKGKEPYALLAVLLFAATYFQFIVVRRPIFIYSALVVLPVALLLVAEMVVALLDKCENAGRGYAVVCAVVIAWGLYLYPLATSRLIPSAVYAPLLSLANLK